MDFIQGTQLRHALAEEYRVYLCGDLKKPQKLKCICDKKNEVGISLYKHFTADLPHFHTTATEYNYIISGSSKIFLLDEDIEVTFEAGSIFVLPPMTRYASKHQANTKVLFFKSPGGNDKQLITMTKELKTWCESW